MKKMIIGVAMLLFANVGFGQISDNAVIPVSVTLNSILRLTVVSGGNIQFVVNTIDDYTSGIANSPRYTTRFNVASSRDFNVLLYSESAAFYGMNYESTGGTGNQMDLNNVGYVIDNIGGATGTTVAVATVTGLSTASAPVLSAVDAGSSTVNTFDIKWELGTTANASMNAQTLLGQSLASDTYVTNVFINVVPI
ncbi:MAG: hypothetical protein JW783_06035 [Bacteroidales bacterium]|nr:hypothetical protein [Bacteroidales bacterium]MBN2750275.1 hypothetical protein [Bacteroidales bacterium]